jgi:hypothetical protein
LKCGFQKKLCASKSPTFFSRKPLWVIIKKMNRQLTDNEKTEIIQEHIPYKLTQLRHHHYYKDRFQKEILPNDQTLYRRHEICAIEIAFVSGRLFLEFLGISFDKKTNQITERQSNQIKADDLFITDFNCDPVKLVSFTQNELDTLATFYNRANKGSGHFTWQTTRVTDGFESVDDGTIIIEKLLKTNLYDKLGLTMKEK